MNLNNNYNLPHNERSNNPYNQNIRSYPMSNINKNIQNQKEIVENKILGNQIEKENFPEEKENLTVIDDINKTVSTVKIKLN